MLFQVAVVKNKQNRFSMKAVGFFLHIFYQTRSIQPHIYALR